MSFESFSLDRRILAGVTACGYETPTPIQTQAIPPVLQGRDVLGLAQTGTGKTAAFALPILQHLVNVDASRRGPVRALVLAPTRELALQIQETFVSLGKQTGFRSTSVFGGVGIVPQIKSLRASSIAVACPGRLLDLINRGECDLSQVDVLVLDEADRMFDMGFLPDLRRILARLPVKRQNLMFSATMPSEIRALAGEVLNDPITLQVNHTVPKTSIEHLAYAVPQRQKTSLLEALLKETDHESVLVFTRTKHRAKSVARILGEKGWRATSLQGNLSQNKRQEALDGFRSGKYSVMVATDIAARGIDCTSISHVINFDLPDTPETYTHRIGRTGRADRTGKALTLVSGEDVSMMRSIERTLGSEITRCTVAGFAYGVQDSTPDQDNFGRPNERNGRNGRYGQQQKSGQQAGRGGKSAPAQRSARQDDQRSSQDRYKDRPYERSSERAGRDESPFGNKRSGGRSPYADQLADDRSKPAYGRAAKPAYGRAAQPAGKFAQEGGVKPWRSAESDRNADAGKRFDRQDRTGNTGNVANTGNGNGGYRGREGFGKGREFGEERASGNGRGYAGDRPYEKAAQRPGKPQRTRTDNAAPSRDGDSRRDVAPRDTRRTRAGYR
ncbi:DEAD/DEAH box helicase [Desulfovibrio psychrotolerans]|uniref:ATP-dependent RNA helicase RhlE n=1 Tax=Desulfovibrio psychrotolerans TaxID=415242 RepID=A0A7J0BQW8_9BACT|nr:DEAD/DEAH box helicase [Desulfovibrio psychrotolerans]GFM36079.1 hypothetical protein DSM19430T_07630 [Desulfovibrio psychrotolerans]